MAPRNDDDAVRQRRAEAGIANLTSLLEQELAPILDEAEDELSARQEWFSALGEEERSAALAGFAWSGLYWAVMDLQTALRRISGKVEDLLARREPRD